jgi:hypothetical protein
MIGWIDYLIESKRLNSMPINGLWKTSAREFSSTGRRVKLTSTLKWRVVT